MKYVSVLVLYTYTHIHAVYMESNVHVHTTCITCTFAHNRPTWIRLNGMKYQNTDYIICGWQDDDLPKFGSISTIFVVNNIAFFKVATSTTVGIDRHYHSYLVRCHQNHCEETVVCATTLIDHQPYRSHLLSNGSLYISIRSHVEKLVQEQ